MSRVTEKTANLVMVALFGKYEGNIAEAPGIKGKLAKLADVPRYRLFHGEIPGKCYLMVSQGTEITNPKKVIITGFGDEEKAVNAAIDGFLRETGVEEVKVPKEEFLSLIESAKFLIASGILPEWLQPPPIAG